MSDQAPIRALPPLGHFAELPPYDPAWRSGLREGEIPLAKLATGPGHLAPRALGHLDPGYLEIYEDLRQLVGPDGPLPGMPRPVLHAETLAVIDGEIALDVMCDERVERIPVLFFDGTEAEALVAALGADRANARRRSRDDRVAAAKAWLRRHPETSNRSLADACRLRDVTIQELRAQAEAEGDVAPADKRLGRDGRVSSLPGMGLRKALEFLRSHPEAADVPDANLAHRLEVDRSTVAEAKQRLAEERSEAARAEPPPPPQAEGASASATPDAPSAAEEADASGAEGWLCELIDVATRMLEHYDALPPALQADWCFSAAVETVEEWARLSTRIASILRPARSQAFRRVPQAG